MPTSSNPKCAVEPEGGYDQERGEIEMQSEEETKEGADSKKENMLPNNLQHPDVQAYEISKVKKENGALAFKNVGHPSVQAEDVLSGIQPLPDGRAARVIIASIPGAHRVEGILAHLRVPQTSEVATCRTATSDNFVGECFLVEDQQEQEEVCETIVGEPIPEKKRSPVKKRIPVVPLMAFSLAAVAVGAAVLFASSKKQQKSRKDPARSSSKPVKTYPPFQEDLPTQVLESLKNGNASCPLMQANAWVWLDPHRLDYSNARRLQRFYLASFYYATVGDEWLRNDHWLSYDVPECQWYNAVGLDREVCDGHGNMTTISLPNNNLQGFFPQVPDFIESLEYFDVSYNQMGGVVPTVISSRNLEVLLLSHNQFEGHVVHGLYGDDFNAFQLRVIKLDGNRLMGDDDMGPLFRFLPKLEVLNATNNFFAKRFPESFQYSTNLVYLGLANNLVYGTIPSELGRLSALQVIDLSGNEGMQGSIPSELAQIDDLRLLNLEGTSISGAVPTEMCARSMNESNANMIVNANCTLLQCCS